MADTIVFEKDGDKVNEISTRDPVVKVWDDKKVLLQDLGAKLAGTNAGIAQGEAIIASYTAEKTKIQAQIDDINKL